MKPREFWYLQEPTSNRALIRDDSEKWPDDVNGRPSEKWTKFYLSDDIHKTIGMGMSRYCEVMEQANKLADCLDSVKNNVGFGGRENLLAAMDKIQKALSNWTAFREGGRK